MLPDGISIVVQGNVCQYTGAVLSSLRRCFLGAEIILSTWEGAGVTGLDYDKIVFSPDPGAELCDKTAGARNNVNRQLVSTKAGIAVAGGKYILKTRTDILFNSADFLKYFTPSKKRPRYLSERMIICNYYTRNPRIFRLCFHPSDWILFGCADDVRKYYNDTPLMSHDDAVYFDTHKKERALFTNYIARYTPEQYIFLGFLRRYETVDAECYYSISDELIRQSELALSDCFIVLDYKKQLDITFCKYNPNKYKEYYSLISHRLQETIYEHYILGSTNACWILFVLKTLLYSMLGRLRRVIVWILDKLRLKEYIKRLL